MIIRFSSLLLALQLLTFSSLGDDYRVGVGKVDITPDYPIRLNGFGNRRAESEGVDQPIFARALSIRLGTADPHILITIDSLGIRDTMVGEVAKRLGILRSNIAVTFTHSHCTPKVNGACDNIFSSPIPESHQRHIDQYTKELTDHLEATARKAIDSERASTLAWSSGFVGFAMNRRLRGGPVDHELPVLEVRNKSDGTLRALYTSYACHATTLSFNKINGDWAGYAAYHLEQLNPGVTALVSIGAGSDSKPASGVTGDRTDVASSQGMEIALEVQRLLELKHTPITGSIKSSYTQIPLALNTTPTRDKLEELAAAGGPAGYNAQTQLARLDRGETLMQTMPYAIQSWKFGDSLCMVFLSGEVCVDYSLRIKTELDGPRIWINAYSNDFCSYIPSERLVKEGGYGGGSEIPYFALPTTLKPGLEQQIVDEVHKQATSAFNPPSKTRGIAPQSPRQSLKSLKTNNRYAVELVASEPLLSDPVAIDFDINGRLWVAEMSNYGHDVYEEFKHTGAIKYLTDQNGDGTYDQANVFLDGLRFPTDVKVWRDGILICDAPDILLARDTTGDGRGDEVKIVAHGFEIRNAQARVNSLRFGLDGWLYGACGLFGGTITSTQTKKVINLRGRDFRFAPDSGELEPASGNSQQGRCRNDWGEWFGCSNGNLASHFPFESRYVRTAPHVKLPPSSIRIATGNNAATLYPAGPLVQFELSGPPGRATSACGIGIYRDSLLGDAVRGNSFTCEPVNQLVHQMELKQSSVTFQGNRPDDEPDSEFLVSTDQWFRPVQARTAPDGSLWIVDMYRFVIEHPRWIPKATLDGIDIYAGTGRGRIFRVAPRSGKTEVAQRRKTWRSMKDMTHLQLADLLAHDNGVIRDLAHQQLLWAEAKEVSQRLKKLVQDSSRPLGQLHALHLLNSWNELDDVSIMTALNSPREEIIRHAVKLSESRMAVSPRIQSKVGSLHKHLDPRIRYQVALSIHKASADQSNEVLASMLTQGSSDQFQRYAVLSSMTAATASYFVATIAADLVRDPSRRDLLARIVSIGDTKTLNKVISFSLEVKRADRWSVLDLITDVIESRQLTDTLDPTPALASQLADEYRNAWDLIAGNEQSSLSQTLSALELLGRTPGSPFRSLLTTPEWTQVQTATFGLLSNRHPASIQSRALATIVLDPNAQTGQRLISKWPTIPLPLRPQVVTALLSRSSWTELLVKALNSKLIRRDALTVSQIQLLRTANSARYRESIDKLFKNTSTRHNLVKRYVQAEVDQGDLLRGKQLFSKHCSACHRLESAGKNIGPDLAALTNKSTQWLVSAILDPNANVDGRYVSWTLALNDGRTSVGMVTEETATTIRLFDADGKEHTIARVAIDAMESSGTSLMPEGLERELTPQSVADLVAYVTNRQANAVVATGETDILPRYASTIAPFLLSESAPLEKKLEVIDKRPGMAAAITSLLTQSIETTDEEYRRIPWIWRVTIAAGKRNDGGEIRDVFEISLARENDVVRAWQIVAIGGGIVNGLSQSGVWPKERIKGILRGAREFEPRWELTLKAAAQMVDDESIRHGTRYDAMRITAVSDSNAIAQLAEYLTSDAPDELQMGAVSGLSDIRDNRIAGILISNLPNLSEKNREIASQALARSTDRASATMNAVQVNKNLIELLTHQFFLDHPNDEIRQKAKALFGPSN